MRSPLPDSGNLEAGIVDDALPSRLSRVHDNVRNLLRRSMLGKHNNNDASSPTVSSIPSPYDNYILPSPIIAKNSSNNPHHPNPQPTPLTSTSTSTPTTSPNEIPGVLFPPWRHQQTPNRSGQPTDTTRALTTNNHPDLTSPALSTFFHQKQLDRQQKAWKRHKHPRKQTRRPPHSSGVQRVFCVILACVLLGLLGTYLALTTSTPVSPILHVLFVLALLLTTIAFIHSLVRLCCLRTRRSDHKRVVRIEPAPRRKRRRRNNTSNNHAPENPPSSRTTTTNRSPPSSPTEPDHFIPPTPIPVHLASDPNPDPETSSSSPSSHEFSTLPRRHAPEMAEVLSSCENLSSREVKESTNRKAPPPAYGSTASSVRADPELLHWQVVPSPVEGALPSPGYEEVVGEGRVEVEARGGNGNSEGAGGGQR